MLLCYATNRHGRQLAHRMSGLTCHLRGSNGHAQFDKMPILAEFFFLKKAACSCLPYVLLINEAHNQKVNPIVKNVPVYCRHTLLGYML